MMSMHQDGDLIYISESKTTLGCLAQSARNKLISMARSVLIAVGVLIIFLYGMCLIALSPDEVNLPPETFRILQIVLAAGICEGLVFVALGVTTQRYPVPATILGLTLFLADSAIWLANGVGQGGAAFLPAQIIVLTVFLLIRAIILVALFKAVKSAIAYQRELKVSAHALDPLA